MESSIVLGIITPGLSFLFALAFFIFWRENPKFTHIRDLALAYLMLGTGFGLNSMLGPWRPDVALFTCGLFSLFCCVPFAKGILGRLDADPPNLWLVGIAAFGIASNCISIFWFNSVSGSFLISSCVASTQMGLVAIAIKKRAKPSQGDKMILRLMFALSGLFILHLVSMISMGLPNLSVENYMQSPFWASFNIIVIFLATALAINLTVLCIIDVTSGLRHRATIDDLSGLLRRGEFIERSNIALSKMNGSCVGTCLIICDIDHFKAINDKFGHPAGDRVIRRFATMLKELVPEGSFAGRIGGEEFGVLLRNSNQATARLFAEQVRSAFANISFGDATDRQTFTVSAGIAEATCLSEYRTLFAEADRALYRAKDLGRNRVYMAGFQTEPESKPTLLSISA